MIYRCGRYPRRTRRMAAGVARGHRSCTSLFLVVAPGSPRSVTTINDIGQTIVPLARRHRAGRRRPPLERAAAHELVPARRRRPELGHRPGDLDLVRGRPRPGGALPGPRRRRLPGRRPVPARRRAAVPVAVAADDGRRAGRDRRAHDALHRRVRELRHLPRRHLHDERGRRCSSGCSPSSTPPPTSSSWRSCSRCSPAGSIASAARCPVVAAGVVSLAVADSAFAYMTAKGTYGDDPITDLGWPLGVRAARAGRGRCPARRRRPGEHAGGCRRRWVSVVAARTSRSSPASRCSSTWRSPGEPMGPFLAVTVERGGASCSSLARC